MGEFETLLVETDDHGVATVTLDRPDRLNAFDVVLTSELHGLWRSLRRDDDVRAIVLTGAGDRAFCTGIDRGDEIPQPTGPWMMDDPGLLLGPKSADLWKPVVAAVNGMACGGAFYMLGEVETIVAAEHATFFDPHVTYGMTAAFEPMLMSARMPFGEIMRLTLLGNHERMSARRALQVGLVQEVVPADELLGRARQLAREIAEGPPVAVQGTVRSIWLASELARSQAVGLAHVMVGLGNDLDLISEGQQRFASGARGMETPMIGPEAASLDGKVALVTGAAQGIGAAAASALARFGADLAICDRDPVGMATTAADIESCGRRCETAELDVRDTDAVTAWLGVLAERYGTIDVLVNNAGGGFYAAVLDVNDKGQRSLIDENFTSVTNFVRGCVPLMPTGSSIVNVTSIEASRAAPGFGVYAAMKAAVESLTKTLALELATRGIRVNALAPDAIPTPGDEGLAEAVSQGAREAYGRKVPLGWGHVDDCAGPIVFLASDLSRYITGTVLHVDGGSHAASGWARRDDGTYEP